MQFSRPAHERTANFDQAPWCDPRAQARVPFEQWYTESTRARWGSWGPPAMRYPPPVDRPHGRLARERVVTVAAALIGLDYQHHHVPSWAPPADWPHKPVRSGRRGPGMDCSNFIGFVYSYALGVDLPTGVGAQSDLHRSTSEGSLFSRRVQVLPLVIDSGGGGRIDAHRNEIPAGVRIRPYRRTGWYARSTVYAHRIIPG